MNEAPSPFTIAFAEGVTLTRWTSAWADRFGGIPLAFIPTMEADQVAVLLERRADVSFVRLPVQQDQLSVIPLYWETPMVVVPKDHPVSAFESVTIADLETEDRVSAALAAADAVELVAAGGGIVILPQSIARLYARKDVVARPVTDAPETRIAIAWLEERTTPNVEEFVGIVRGRTANSSRLTPTPPTVKVQRKVAAPVRKPQAKRRKPRQGR